MIEETRRIDTQTGEVLTRNVRQFDVFDEEKGYLFWARKKSARSFQEINFPSQMTMKERGMLWTLTKRIWSNTNMLAYRSAAGIRPMDVKMVARDIQVGERQAFRFLAKMVRLGVMKQVRVKGQGRDEIQWYINPIYFHSSNRIPLNLYLIFREELNEHLPPWVKQRFAEIQEQQEGAKGTSTTAAEKAVVLIKRLRQSREAKLSPMEVPH